MLVICYINSVVQPPYLELSGNDIYVFYTRKEFAPTVISDDNQSFCYSHEGNTVKLTDDPLVFISGENSLKIVLSKTPVGISVVYHDFVPSADWSSKDSISFFWYGAKSNVAFNVIVECKEGYYKKEVVDNWRGWKQLLFSFREMEKLSQPDLKQVKRLVFQIATGGYTDVLWRLDRVTTETIDNTPVIYNTTFGGQIYIKNHGKILNSVTMEEFFIDHTGAEVHAFSEEIQYVPSGKSLVNFNFTVNLSGPDEPPRMTKFTILIRLFAESGLQIGEFRCDVSASPYVLKTNQP